MALSLSARIGQLKKTASEAPVVGILVRAGLRGSRSHVKDMAASIAFFSFLSLFPLILGMTALAGSILKSEKLRLQVTGWVTC